MDAIGQQRILGVVLEPDGQRGHGGRVQLLRVWRVWIVRPRQGAQPRPDVLEKSQRRGRRRNPRRNRKLQPGDVLEQLATIRVDSGRELPARRRSGRWQLRAPRGATRGGCWKTRTACGRRSSSSGVCQLSLYYADLYDLRGVGSIRDLTARLIEALGVTSLILAGIYFLAPDWIVGRGVFLISVVFMVTLVVAWRIAFAWLTQRVAPRERLLLVGTNTAAVELARELFERRQELGVEIVGFVDPDPTRVGMPVLNPGVVGAIDDIPLLVSKLNVDRVVVSLADARGKLPMDRLLDIRLDSGVTFDHLASVYEEYTGKIAVENLRPSWLIFSEGFRKTRLLMTAKRVLDVVFSAAGLLHRRADHAARRRRGALHVVAARSCTTSGASVGTDASSRPTSSGRCARTPRARPVRSGALRTTPASPPSAASCAGRVSTRCRSSGTCSSAT